MNRSTKPLLGLLMLGTLVVGAQPAAIAAQHQNPPGQHGPEGHQGPQGPQGPQGQGPSQHPTPPVLPYRGPHDYRPGHRPFELQRPPGFDHRDYRRNYRAERHYRMPPYARPRGWFFQRWMFGEVLPAIFWSRNYWIADYWRYGLPIPPAGYVWVRYGSDALLVDRDSGEILQVIYGIFY